MKNLLQKLDDSLRKHTSRRAFRIGTTDFTYQQYSDAVAQIRSAIRTGVSEEQRNIGLVVNDDLETYAAILACWFEGRAYVPLNTTMPAERNDDVIAQAEILTIIDSSPESIFSKYNLISSKSLEARPEEVPPREVSSSDLAYIFFTSGTTGVPKGVPITFANLTGFVEAYNRMGYHSMDHTDRVLQMFELTFDLSVMSYLIPLLHGAAIFPIPKDKVKYSYIFELMEDHELTVALMVPSILHYLRPYFDEINCPSMRFNMFCGEALPIDITEEWSKCIPNARIANVYGPTEDTIFCTDYEYNRDGHNKSYNGVMGIGQSMYGNMTIIVDDDNNILGEGEKGELCLGGVQLTLGYWKNPTKNAEVFFYVDYMGKPTRFYRTGDLCSRDKDGDLSYLGRIDFQTKIQGFRVELSEIEYRAKEVLPKVNVVAVAYHNQLSNAEIGLVIESKALDTGVLSTYLSRKLPGYMLPSEIMFLDAFPLNTNGKTDRKALSQLFGIKS